MVVILISPPSPLTSEKEEIASDVIFPGAVISTGPPLPVWDEEDNSPSILILPVLLVMVISPPLLLLLPSVRESIAPVLRSISPSPIILIFPPGPSLL